MKYAAAIIGLASSFQLASAGSAFLYICQTGENSGSVMASRLHYSNLEECPNGSNAFDAFSGADSVLLGTREYCGSDIQGANGDEGLCCNINLFSRVEVIMTFDGHEVDLGMYTSGGPLDANSEGARNICAQLGITTDITSVQSLTWNNVPPTKCR